MINEIVRGVLVVDHATAGHLSQPFEQGYPEVVVFDAKGADIRQFECQAYEASSVKKRYAVHHERIDAPVVCPCFDQMAQCRFFVAYQRAIDVDRSDVRKAVRFALKAMVADGWPPG